MALSRRYVPSWPPGEAGPVGFDFSPVLAPGTTLASGELSIVINQNPVQPQNDFSQSDPTISGRRVWCDIAGGVEGTDYQFRWSAIDSAGNTWNRTALLLCAQSS